MTAKWTAGRSARQVRTRRLRVHVGLCLTAWALVWLFVLAAAAGFGLSGWSWWALVTAAVGLPVGLAGRALWRLIAGVSRDELVAVRTARPVRPVRPVRTARPVRPAPRQQQGPVRAYEGTSR